MTSSPIRCARCGREIVPTGSDRWKHIDPQGDLIRGCYAASFVDDEGWDESLNRSWTAKPPKGVTAADMPRVLSESDKQRALLIAMAVRNELERIHGGGNDLDRTEDGGDDGGLTDEQMAAINPIVRNAVASTLYALEHASVDLGCAAFIAFQQMLLPDYWEQPEFLASLAELPNNGLSAEARTGLNLLLSRHTPGVSH